jgi:hypothetical protein
MSPYSFIALRLWEGYIGAGVNDHPINHRGSTPWKLY